MRPARSGAISMSVSSRSTLTMPQSRKYASSDASSPASAPVCERASAAPSRERPSLYATTGFPAAWALRAAAARPAPSRIVSRNKRITRVPGSSASSSTSSAIPRSDSLPTETSLAKPRPRAAPRESTVPSMVPLCDTKLVVPAGKTSISSTALTVSVARPGTSMSPMLLGPSTRTPSVLARATSRACRAAPSAPASAKPSLKIVATGTPRAPHSSIARSTESPGVMMKAWSIAPGASARLRQARSPSTSLRDALIGTMRPA